MSSNLWTLNDFVLRLPLLFSMVLALLLAIALPLGRGPRRLARLWVRAERPRS